MRSVLTLSLLLVSTQLFADLRKTTKPTPTTQPSVVKPQTVKAPVVAVQPLVISNQLPLEYVRELNTEKLWLEGMDDPKHPDGQSMLQFIGFLKSSNQAQRAVDSIFGIDEDEVPHTKHLYSVKLHLLRFLLANPSEQTKLRIDHKYLLDVETQWKKRYVGSIVTLLKVSNISQYDPILENFNRLQDSGQIRIIDLSPFNREQLHNEIGESHGIGVTEKNEQGYVVNGLYAENKKVFAVDLSRSFQDTVVTLAHEIVHAADPQIEEYRQQYQSLLPKVEAILAVATGTSATDLSSSMIEQVFYEIGQAELLAQANFARINLSDKLKKISSGISEKISQEDAQTLRTWMRAVVGITVENEYKAYGLSLMAYDKLRTGIRLLRLSEERELFVRQVIAGDSIFANQIAQSMNPFRRRMDSYKILVQKFQLSGELKIKVDHLIGYLEAIYLDETSKFIISLNDQFSKAMKNSSKLAKIYLGPDADTRSSLEILPEWARPGQFNSPTNPFTVVGARISTIQVVRFRDNLNKIQESLKRAGESLYVLRAGVLDLHDLSMGDFKFLGVYFAETKKEDLPVGLGPSFYQDLPEMPKLIQRFAQLTPFQNGLETSDNMIDGQTLIQKLLQLRLLKGLVWFDEIFPKVTMDVVGIKMTLEKLRQGQYSKNEISSQRSKEIQEELIDNLERTKFSSHEISSLAEIFDVLMGMHYTSVDMQWSEISTQFKAKAYQAQAILSNLGIQNSYSAEKFHQQLKNSLQSFYQQMGKGIQECQSIAAALPLALKEPIIMQGFQFPLYSVCYKGSLYLVRQPSDSLSPMSLMVRSVRVGVRIFRTGRMIQLLPFQYLGRFQ